MIKIRKDLTDEQIRAIRLISELGLRLQRDLPEIVEDYRRGMFALEIVSKYDIISMYGITKNIAKEAVYRALRGNIETRLGIKNYGGLLEEDEIEELRMKHFLRRGRIGARRILELGIGIHGRTSEQKNEDLRKATIGRGETPWEPEEIEFAYQLSQDPNYRLFGRYIQDKINSKLIAERINKKYHRGIKVRTSISIHNKIKKLKKQRTR